MFISQAYPLINRALEINDPVMLHGSTGIGKSDLIAAIAKDRGLPLIDIRLSQFESVDLKGVPCVLKSLTHWNPPAAFPRDGKGLIFFDEINQASQNTQAAAYQLILDRRLGDYVLPDGWRMAAAGNRLIDRAIVQKMGTALKNRFAHISLQTDHESWHQWAVRNAIHSVLLGFLRFKPKLLNQLDDTQYKPEEIRLVQDQNAFATPRTWAKLHRYLGEKFSSSDLNAYATMTVGEGPAAELTAFYEVYREMPDPKEVLKNPDKFEPPTKLSARYALLTAMAAFVDKTTFENGIKFIERTQPEYQSMFMRDVLLRDATLSNNRAFAQWTVKNTAFIT